MEMNGANVTGVKSALAAMGHDCGPTRPPAAWPLAPKQHARLTAFLVANRLVAS
jgi:4-hydroxy-tetrahydrodipicolinate synthase